MRAEFMFLVQGVMLRVTTAKHRHGRAGLELLSEALFAQHGVITP